MFLYCCSLSSIVSAIRVCVCVDWTIFLFLLVLFSLRRSVSENVLDKLFSIALHFCCRKRPITINLAYEMCCRSIYCKAKTKLNQDVFLVHIWEITIDNFIEQLSALHEPGFINSTTRNNLCILCAHMIIISKYT